MPRYIKNFIIIASLLLVSCANPILPEAITAPEVTNQTVEVRTSLGEILEVLIFQIFLLRNNEPAPPQLRYVPY